MKFDPQKHHRRSIRLRGYDYAGPGAYFVTICTHRRECLFGEIVNRQMRVNQIGSIVVEEWLQSPIIRPEIELDTWVVMPNHIHGIIVMTKPGGAYGGTPRHDRVSPDDIWGMPYRKPRSLSSLIAGFKSAATKRINAIRNMPGAPVWQRNYYERIIRDEEALHTIRRYIIENPRHWTKDIENRSSRSTSW